MKKLFLLLLMVGAGFTAQAQENWKDQSEIFDQVYSLATDLNKQTEKVTANGNIISVTTGKGTISVEKRLDKAKPKELNHYQFYLLTTNGKEILLQKLNAEKVIESFQAKLLQLKDQLRENQDAEVESILDNLFN